ncbi:MAG: GAF domain-containing sensor histidine kinase [Leptolyngbyaceae bacterium]|nr:GAF domain-containing sensor histidine kinase [Leptolyngbyaceae bacterium]
MLNGHEQLLETTAKAANVLLTLENFDAAVNSALQFIGEGTGCDCVVVLENMFQSDSLLPSSCDFIYEWAAPGFLPISVAFGSTSLPAELLGLDFMQQYFLEGDGFGGLTEVWNEPLRSALVSVQVQSTYAVPIRVNGQWWGVLSLDYCRAPIQVSSAEISVLMAIADCIGSAILRDRSQKEREQAAQQRASDLEEYNQSLLKRDRLLTVTARATNVLLTGDSIDVAMDTALTILIEGTGCDRLEVLENVYESSSLMPVRYLDTMLKCMDPKFEIIRDGIGPAEAAELSDAFRKYMLEMDGFGGLLEEWDEPLRSWLAKIQIQSTYAVPIRVNGQWWGVLCLDYCRAPIRFSPAEVAVLRTMADCIGSAIQRDRTQKIILQSEQARVAELVTANTALKQSLDTFVADSDLDRFIGSTLMAIAQQFDAPLVQYWVHSQPGREAYIHLAYWQGQILKAAQASTTNVDPSDMIPFLDIPLSVGNTNIGVLSIYLPIHRPFSRQTIELAHALAQQLTLAVELTRLAEEAQQAALLQERARVAREIHDTLAQAFGGIIMQLQAVDYFIATQPAQAQTHLMTALALARDGLAEARRSVWTLYLETSEYEDPAQTIAKFITQTSPGQSAHIHLDIQGVPYRLHPDLGLNLLRIAQESIANALRHAQANRIQISLTYRPQTLRVCIQDDGCGFDPTLPARGFGLSGMQQRAARIGATWHLMSRPGEGTMITVTLDNPTLA